MQPTSLLPLHSVRNASSHGYRYFDCGSRHDRQGGSTPIESRVTLSEHDALECRLAAGTPREDRLRFRRRKSIAEPGLFSDLVQLTKPRIVVMILVTTAATALIGAQGAVGLLQMAWLLLGTGLIAGSAGAANQVWERID